MKKTAISIIIPIFNTEKYLIDCFSSIRNQSFTNFEVLLIDDCSTDNSARICKTYCDQDNRFRYMAHKRRQGSGPARNLGLEIASGKYAIFCDSDDAYTPNALALLYNAAERDNADIAGGNLIFMDSTLTQNLGLSQTLTCITFTENKVTSFDRSPALWLPIYHQRFLISKEVLKDNNIAYPNLLRGQDPPFLAHAFCHAQRISIIPDFVYIVRNTSKGTNKFSSEKAINDYICHFEDTFKIFQSHGHPKMAEFYLAHALTTVFSLKFLYKFSRQKRKKLFEALLSMIKSSSDNFLKADYKPYDIDLKSLRKYILLLEQNIDYFFIRLALSKLVKFIKKC